MMKRVMQNTDPLLGRPVGSLQTMLRLLSQGDSAIAPVAPDGIFGRCTLRSVTDFQRAFSLPVTGTVDDAIWRALVAAYDTARVRQDAAAPLLIYLGPDAAISDDEKQGLLNELFPPQDDASTDDGNGDENSDDSGDGE